MKVYRTNPDKDQELNWLAVAEQTKVGEQFLVRQEGGWQQWATKVKDDSFIIEKDDFYPETEVTVNLKTGAFRTSA